MDILDDMGVSKLSAKVFWKVNYSFKWQTLLEIEIYSPSCHYKSDLYIAPETDISSKTCVPQKKEKHTGLERNEEMRNEKMMTEYLFLG